MLTDSHIWNGLSAQYTHMTDQFEGRCANFFFRSTIITFSPFSLRQSDWPPLTHYVSKDDLKRLNFLSPKSWDYRCVPPCLIYAVLTVQSRALHMLSKQPLHQATLIAWDVIIFKAPPPQELWTEIMKYRQLPRCLLSKEGVFFILRLNKCNDLNVFPLKLILELHPHCPGLMRLGL